MLLLLLIVLAPVILIIALFWLGSIDNQGQKREKPLYTLRTQEDDELKDDYDRQELEIRAHTGDEMAKMLLAERYGIWEDSEEDWPK